MKIRRLIYILTIVAAICVSKSTVAANEQEATADSLREVLKTKTTAADSLPLLYDLLDLSSLANRSQAAEALYATSQRVPDPSIQLDVMRRLGTIYSPYSKYASRIGELVNKVAGMPQSHEQRATLAFLKIEQLVAESADMKETDRQEKVYDLMQFYGTDRSNDPYDRVELLFMLCQLLQKDITETQLSKYLAELYESLENLPDAGNALQSLYYNKASLVYTNAELPSMAIETIHRFIKLIDDLKASSEAEGRKYRTYDTFYYTAYRRLLNNYRALTDAEVEKYYTKITELAAKNKDVAGDFEHNQRPTIYYLMAKKRYREALDLLKKQVDNPSNRIYLNQLYADMLEAATALNDREGMLTAALGSNRLMHGMLTDRGKERVKELEVLDKLQSIRNSNTLLQELQRQKEIAFHHKLIIVAFSVAGLLLVVLVILLLLFGRARRLSRRLRDSNNELTNERDTLQRTQKELIEARDHARRADRHKTEFINNMSHEVKTPLSAIVECAHLIVDNMDESKQHYMQRYAKMIDVSADMLQTFVNDVLSIASMDNSVSEVQRKPESINAICSIAIESMRKHLKDGVEMEYLNAGDEDISIFTDARRVEQVLINLLSNATKFTDEGYVHLSYRMNPATDTKASTVTFVVEDTGIGVPKGKEEIIFERFEKLSNTYSGTGLGLNICRMVAEMLHGEVRVDTTYQGPGARFLFTIPIS